MSRSEVEITTPLGDQVLLFHAMHAHEEMSRLFDYRLDLLSPKPDINLDDILGKNVTVKLAMADDSTRYFNGYVTRFAQGGTYGRYNRYFAVVHPWLWFLTRTTDCRIFQEMTVPDIVKKVFGDHPTADFKLELTGSYRKWTYCVQYRETDYNFVSRLMEEEGIYFYVRHTDGHNTVVLTDSTAKQAAAPGYDAIPFIAPEQPGASRSSSTSAAGISPAKFSLGFTCTTTTISSGRTSSCERRKRPRAATRKAHTRCTTIRGTTCRRRTENSTRRYASMNLPHSSKRRPPRPTPRGSDRRKLRCCTLEGHPRAGSEPRAPDRRIGQLCSLDVRRLRGAAAGHATGAGYSVQVTWRCRASSSSGPGASRSSHSCRGHRLPSSLARRATKSTRTTTDA